ncbi:hypothetical protein QR680_010790 [Steinernema hermaphroditum]|nr:hypothetical protein QR680_010790 [Steinernema hermaphroditum]
MALPYIAYEDDSSLNIETLPQPSYTNILEKIYASNRQFTCLDLQYVSDINTCRANEHVPTQYLMHAVLQDTGRFATAMNTVAFANKAMKC